MSDSQRVRDVLGHAPQERARLEDAARSGAVLNGPLVVAAWCRLA